MTKKKKMIVAIVLCCCMVLGIAGVAVAANGIVTVNAELRPDFRIMIDGAERTFYDATGTEVQPLLYHGTTYLPVRAIGELMGKTVSWDQTQKLVTLSGGTQVAEPTQNTTQTTANGEITAEQAKAIALEHAGVAEADASFVWTERDYENGRLVYEVEFYTADHREYDYEIDAATGAVVGYDYDAEYYNGSAVNGNSNYISEATAKQTALNHAGLTESEVSRLQVKFDYDDGRAEYDVDFHVDRTEYDYTIDAVSGSILEVDIDRD